MGRQTLFPRNASKSFALLRHHPSYTPSDKTHLMSLANRCSRGAMFLVDFSLPPSLPPSLPLCGCVRFDLFSLCSLLHTAVDPCSEAARGRLRRYPPALKTCKHVAGVNHTRGERQATTQRCNPQSKRCLTPHSPIPSAADGFHTRGIACQRLNKSSAFLSLP